jgi:hypothetical protein
MLDQNLEDMELIVNQIIPIGAPTTPSNRPDPADLPLVGYPIPIIIIRRLLQLQSLSLPDLAGLCGLGKVE